MKQSTISGKTKSGHIRSAPAKKKRRSASKQKKLQVTQIRYGLHAETGYCVCPRCKCTFEREFQHYCDRCGQHLGWDEFRRNHVTLIRRIECHTVSRQKNNEEVALAIL